MVIVKEEGLKGVVKLSSLAVVDRKITPRPSSRR
jgi:hypothetical protein